MRFMEFWYYFISIIFWKFPYGFKSSKYMVVKLIGDEEGFNYEKTNLPALDDIFNGLLQINPKKRLTFEQFFDLVFNYDFMDEQENQSFKEKYDEYMALNAKESKKSEVNKELQKEVINNSCNKTNCLKEKINKNIIYKEEYETNICCKDLFDFFESIRKFFNF